MSTLQKSLHERRAIEAPLVCVVMAATPAPALTVRMWRGETWVLPWSHLLSARLTDDARLEIAFTRCLLIVTGEALGGLLDDLAGFRIATLRDLPVDYRNQTSGSEPFVTRLEMTHIQPVT